jgi:hypothetical protein
MRSPVYGARAGNVKCNGKKTKLLSCYCCMMINCKWEQRLKEADKEIRDEAKTDRQGT